jgi:hypothetical protein
MTALELDINLGPCLLSTVAPPDQSVESKPDAQNYDRYHNNDDD